MKRIFLIVTSLFLLSSCQTLSLYSFQGLNAPKILIPADVKTIGFVDRNTSFKIDTVSQYYLINSTLLTDTTDYSTDISTNCYLGFTENLSEYLAMDSIPFIQLDKKEISGDRDYTPMKWELVDSICESNGSDILICLEDVQLYNKYTVFEDILNYGITDANYFAVWRIYDPLKQTYLDEQIVIDSLFSEVTSPSYNRLIEEKLPKRKDLFKDVSYEIGNQYADMLAPKWIDITRKYFASGDDRLAISKYYIDQGDWETPISLWTEISDEKDDKLAGRASYNLAVAYEIKEDYVQANRWIRKSIFHYKTLKSLPSEFKLVTAYTLELLERTKNKEKLDLFFGE
ncbi:hypothetical protein BZG01_08915 [Labilibaculum manganireducens]|uniref:Tetratricopeptide repeat protein n=1 Tax=Labilibaculum manganireducens TaxID=1940525 RepID=A0A2N3I9J7_9BACT|nr:DUF6340 family protein [Labilibaculum manganireducens]PKQ66913.1 hypothetical protein BZG01_08915 [Labilibaculum manganireducens]